MNLKTRPLVLCIGLAVALAASAMTYFGEKKGALELVQNTSLPNHRKEKDSAINVSKPIEDDGGQSRATYDDASTDPFAAISWYEAPSPPPSVPQVIVPQQQVAPPLPFRYFGKTEVVGEDETVSIHLLKDSVVYSVRVGEKIDENYLLEKMDEEKLYFEFIPLATKQTLIIGMKQ